MKAKHIFVAGAYEKGGHNHFLILGENSKPAADAKWYLNVRIVLTAYSCWRASLWTRLVISTLNLELV